MLDMCYTWAKLVDHNVVRTSYVGLFSSFAWVVPGICSECVHKVEYGLIRPYTGLAIHSPNKALPILVPNIKSYILPVYPKLEKYIVFFFK